VLQKVPNGDHTPLSLVTGYLPYKLSTRDDIYMGTTPIHNYLLELLLEFGADPGLSNSAEQTPYLWASFYADLYEKHCGKVRVPDDSLKSYQKDYKRRLTNYRSAQKILEVHPNNVRYGVIRYKRAYCRLSAYSKAFLVVEDIDDDGKYEYR